jgi:hypothetical protein
MITINIGKAKVIAHDMRRKARAEEFKPHDMALAAQIPGQMEGAELARQAIRDKYVIMQTAIDTATTVDEIKTALLQEA